MEKNNKPRKVACQGKSKVAPKHLIVDDRNIYRKSRKCFDPVAEQQAYEFSQIPFQRKIQYAKRYFKEHCHDCYCRDGLVSPTSKYLYQEANSSDNEDNLTCACPLNHPCNLKCLSNDSRTFEHESPTPFLTSKKRQQKRSPRRKHVSTCSERSSYDTRRRECSCIEKTSCFDRSLKSSDTSYQRQRPVRRTSCSDTSSCERGRTKFCLKNRDRRNKKVIRSQKILEDSSTAERICICRSDDTRGMKLTVSTIKAGNYKTDATDAESGLTYTKSREKYELHNVPQTYKNRGDNIAQQQPLNINDDVGQLNDVSEFREQFYFDTHDPFSKNMPPTGTKASSKSKDQSTVEIDKHAPPNNKTFAPQQHKCVYSFCLNSRLLPVATNPDEFGRARCDECGKPMMTVRNGEIEEISKEVLNCKDGTCVANCKDRNQCSGLCPALGLQRVHLGCGNERIRLTVPNDLLEESIGRSVEITASTDTKKSVKQKGKGSVIKEKVSWNSAKRTAGVEAALRPPSLALRHQKLSLYKK